MADTSFSAAGGASGPGGGRDGSRARSPRTLSNGAGKKDNGAPQPTLQHPPNRRAFCNRGPPPGDLLGGERGPPLPSPPPGAGARCYLRRSAKW